MAINLLAVLSIAGELDVSERTMFEGSIQVTGFWPQGVLQLLLQGHYKSGSMIIIQSC